MAPIQPLHFDIFNILVEVVPPPHNNPASILSELEHIAGLPFHSFNIATNPVAKPRLSALALSTLIQHQTGKPAVLHVTPRDHNRLALQSLLWGAQALGIHTVLITTGDIPDRKRSQDDPTFIGDLSVFDLVRLSAETGLQVGVVFDPPRESDQLSTAIARLHKKKKGGASFAITQPTYQAETARAWSEALQSVELPVFLGVLPLRSQKHAEFMDQHVAGIHIPEDIFKAMNQAVDPGDVGIEVARSMIQVGRDHFHGICLMPPFQQYRLVADLLQP